MLKICFLSLRGSFEIFGKALGCFQKEIRFPKYQLEKQKFRPLGSKELQCHVANFLNFENNAN
jgi:hypothetical protein